MLPNGPRAGQQGNIDAGADQVDVLANGVGLPVAGEIGMAIGGARGGSGGRPFGIRRGSIITAKLAELQVLRLTHGSRLGGSGRCLRNTSVAKQSNSAVFIAGLRIAQVARVIPGTAAYA